MKFVLDSSVAVKWVLKEVGTPKALALREDVRAMIHDVIVPDVYAIRYFERRRRNTAVARPKPTSENVDGSGTANVIVSGPPLTRNTAPRFVIVEWSCAAVNSRNSGRVGSVINPA